MRLLYRARTAFTQPLCIPRQRGGNSQICLFPHHTATATMSSSAPSSTRSTIPQDDPTVQYIVVRRDLMSTWPTGSLMAQAVHASVAAIWESRNDTATSAYCSLPGNGDDTASNPQMHTVVLEAPNESSIHKLATKLTEADIKYVMWREQPEDYVTALAAKPYPRSEIKKHFSKFRLFK